MHSETTEGTHRVATHPRLVPECFPGVYIADVHFHYRHVDGRYGIGYGQRGVRKRCGIEHNALNPPGSSPVELADHIPFIRTIAV